MRTLAFFSSITLLHFVLSVVGIIVTLPAAFETQESFWGAPGKAILVWISNVLLAPLYWAQSSFPEQISLNYVSIALLSIMFGMAGIGLKRLWKTGRLKAWR